MFSRHPYGALVVVIVVLAAFFGLAVARVSAPGGPLAEKAALTTGGVWERSILGEATDLFSIGVADVDGDRRLDVITMNHAFAGLFLMNRGSGRFEDARTALGLSSNPIFPDAEIAPAPPTIDRPGLYLFWQEGMFRMVSEGLDWPAPRQVDLVLSGGILAEASGGITLAEHIEVDKKTEFPTHMRLVIDGDGSLTLRSLRWAVNGEIALDPAVDLDAVFVGQGKASPRAHDFALFAGGDRHGAAWSDLDADGVTDVVFIEGGEAGLMTTPQPYPVAFGNDTGFAPAEAVPGLVQELCPSRQILLRDVTGDGRDDIYVVCGRGTPPRQDHPNELFVRTNGMYFVNRAAALGLALPELGRAVWFDAERNGAPELLWVTDRDITVLARRGDVFAPVFTAEWHGPTTQIARGDLDGSGWPDFFIGSRAGNSVVLKSGPEGFVLVEPETIGLPRRATCANFVDIDNDGTDEFHALPEGLFVRSSRGRQFEATGRLASGPHSAFCMWFDADNDGTRDLLVALPATDPLFTRVWRKLRTLVESVQYRGRYTGRVYDPNRYEIALYRTDPTTKRWLEIDLAGPLGNPSGVGALITVAVGDWSLSREVGQAEGSLSSNGHFRSYFGLGNAEKVEALTIRWPDGTMQRVSPPPLPDRLIRLVHPSARGSLSHGGSEAEPPRPTGGREGERQAGPAFSAQ